MLVRFDAIIEKKSTIPVEIKIPTYTHKQLFIFILHMYYGTAWFSYALG